MAMTLSGLLSSPTLKLKPLAGTDDAADSALSWAAVTELADPTPFLAGGEVLLTTGVRQKTVASQTGFVDHAVRAGVLALGYGTGLTHARVPAAVIRRATEVGLPLFEVPYETPFVAITRIMAEALAAENVARVEGLLQGHQRLASALLSGGLHPLLRELRRQVQRPVALTQYGARIHGPAPAAEGWQSVAVSTGLQDRCTLYLEGSGAGGGLIEYAQSLISVELAGRARLRESRRTTSGQVLSDLTRGMVEGQDAALRLQSIGIAPHAAHTLLLVEALRPNSKALPTLPLPPGREKAVSAMVEDRLAVVLDAGDGEVAASEFATYLSGAGIPAKVSYGGSYAQVTGLRWSYFEAVEALRHGARINHPSRISLTSLLLAAHDVPLQALAAEALEPLTDFDAAHGSDLMLTLRRFLELNGSVGTVAEALGLHRNTVRYRLQQLAVLSGYDPSNPPDRV
ncbi:MAG: PucR family transcriptional regulator ligand-binding domain-containing protein, partial [Micrococcaceae bacterium]|nr:PucR family transcriptional regulator ligand-binding domain-containing protein [Micrococcaceae bacterium]